MKYALIIITFLTLIINGCDKYFTEKSITTTTTTLPITIHTKLPEGWKIQRNAKNEYRLIKPNGNVLYWFGDHGGSQYKDKQKAIDSAWKYIQMQIDNELESKWHDIETE